MFHMLFEEIEMLVGTIAFLVRCTWSSTYVIRADDPRVYGSKVAARH